MECCDFHMWKRRQQLFPIAKWRLLCIRPWLSKKMQPSDHLVDAMYVGADLLVSSQLEHGVRPVGLVGDDTHWQAREGKGFDLSCFTIDREAKRAICPRGYNSVKWLPRL